MGEPPWVREAISALVEFRKMERRQERGEEVGAREVWNLTVVLAQILRAAKLYGDVKDDG
jgi:hypothetical protein